MSPRSLVALSYVILALVGFSCSREPQHTRLLARMEKRDVPESAGRGACPPFRLRAEDGEIIDPVAGVRADRPYSPRQTCGAQGCHDYELITAGYHFQQGKGESVPDDQARRWGWVTSPGYYGGPW